MKVRFDSPKERDPNRNKGIRLPYAPGKRSNVRWRWYLVLLLLCSPLLYFLFNLGLTRMFVSAHGIVSLDPVTVNSSTAGVLKHLSVKVGQDVKAGEELAVLVNLELNERDHILRSELAALDSNDREAMAENSAAGFHFEKIGLAQKQADYRFDLLKKVRRLFDNGAATIAELSLAEAQHNQALYNLNDARSSYNNFQEKSGNGTSAERRETLARVGRLEAELLAVGDQRERLIQKAPESGRVLENFAAPGQALSVGAPILSIGRVERPSVIAYLDPKHADYAQAGSKARVRFSDGTVMDAVVRDNTRLTKRLSPETSYGSAPKRMLVVELDFLEELAPEKRVEGFPVNVRFDAFP
jgi:multidrug resistance efflux pump